jgi:tetratricopeptide (TPR) repeat protein
MKTYLRYCALLSVAALMGCTTPSFPGMGAAPTPMPEKTLTAEMTKVAAQAKEPELPPEKAARLCLAAADELEKGGHFAHAISQCELAHQHSPNHPGLSRKLAGLYARDNQLEKAIDEYKKEVAKSPRDADLLNDLGYCCYQAKDYAAAEKYLRQAVAAKPNLQRAHANLGLALGRQEKWRESLEEFKKAGSVAAAHANLAAMYHAVGRDEDARRECKIALGLDPQLHGAQDLLAKLEETAKEQQTIRQAEMKLTARPTPAVQVAEATPTADAGAIQLKRPVVTKREAPQFKPAK